MQAQASMAVTNSGGRSERSETNLSQHKSETFASLVAASIGVCLLWTMLTGGWIQWPILGLALLVVIAVGKRIDKKTGP
jgi:hypothetical protein